MGDFAGHPFRGNQWTGSQRSGPGFVGTRHKMTAQEEENYLAAREGRKPVAVDERGNEIKQPVGPYSKSLAERDAAYKAARVAALAERTPAQKQAAALAASRLGTPAQGPTRSYGDEKRSMPFSEMRDPSRASTRDIDEYHSRIETVASEQLAAGRAGRTVKLPAVLKVTERGVNVSKGDYLAKARERSEFYGLGNKPETAAERAKLGDATGRDRKAGLARGGRSRVRNAANRTKRTW